MSLSGEEMKVITCRDIDDEDCSYIAGCGSCPAYGWLKSED